MSKISKAKRLKVAKRARYRCEYCCLHEDDLFLSFELDHIIAIKHGGSDDLENLAYACPHCNQHKGSDLVTVLDDSDEFVPLFNPRVLLWEEHFRVLEGEIIPKTNIGRATVKLLQFNSPDLLILRKLLHEVGRYP
jgi:5-methylcytosine-specific restriction endonuclease McrA